jgi:hypothetical protein
MTVRIAELETQLKFARGFNVSQGKTMLRAQTEAHAHSDISEFLLASHRECTAICMEMNHYSKEALTVGIDEGIVAGLAQKHPDFVRN